MYTPQTGGVRVKHAGPCCAAEPGGRRGQDELEMARICLLGSTGVLTPSEPAGGGTAKQRDVCAPTAGDRKPAET